MSGHHHYHHHPRNRASIRALSESLPETSYPGVNPYADFSSADLGVSSFYPYGGPGASGYPPVEVLNPGAGAGFGAGPEIGAVAPVAASPAPASGGGGGLGSLLGGLNLGNLDFKGIIEKMGGIDGLVNNLGKVQKVMQGFQQIAPMMSLFAGALGGKGSAGAGSEKGGAVSVPPRRRTSARRRARTRRRRGGRRG